VSTKHFHEATFCDVLNYVLLDSHLGLKSYLFC